MHLAQNQDLAVKSLTPNEKKYFNFLKALMGQPSKTNDQIQEVIVDDIGSQEISFESLHRIVKALETKRVIQKRFNPETFMAEVKEKIIECAYLNYYDAHTRETADSAVKHRYKKAPFFNLLRYPSSGDVVITSTLAIHRSELKEEFEIGKFSTLKPENYQRFLDRKDLRQKFKRNSDGTLCPDGKFDQARVFLPGDKEVQAFLEGLKPKELSSQWTELAKKVGRIDDFVPNARNFPDRILRYDETRAYVFLYDGDELVAIANAEERKQGYPGCLELNVYAKAKLDSGSIGAGSAVRDVLVETLIRNNLSPDGIVSHMFSVQTVKYARRNKFDLDYTLTNEGDEDMKLHGWVIDRSTIKSKSTSQLSNPCSAYHVSPQVSRGRSWFRGLFS